MQEHEVQQAALGGLDQVTEVGDIERPRRLRRSPRMVAAASNRSAEDQVFVTCAHGRTAFRLVSSDQRQRRPGCTARALGKDGTVVE
jgi:hypothetical protein